MSFWQGHTCSRCDLLMCPASGSFVPAVQVLQQLGGENYGPFGDLHLPGDRCLPGRAIPAAGVVSTLHCMRSMILSHVDYGSGLRTSALSAA